MQSVLAAPRLPLVLAGASMVLVLPSVWSGLQFDDYPQRALLLNREPPSTTGAVLLDMFSFLDGHAASAKAEMNAGALPWWTFEDVRIRFFRPLSAVTHVLDYRLWPESPKLMHLHSILWFGLMAGVATRLYRRVMTSAWVAGLAACMYAFDEAHGITAGWIAHRNATIATVFGILALLAHIRWQRDRWRPGAVLAPACLGLGLLASEGAIATGAYLLAYQVLAAPGGRFRRYGAMLPYGVVAGIWFVIYHHLEFGTWGSGAYVDPATQPLLYLRALLERGPLLLSGQWFSAPLVYLGVAPPHVCLAIFLGVLVCLLAILVLLVPLLKRDRVARFWALGMAMSLAPICASSPSNRLLMFVGLGAAPLCAQLMASWFDADNGLPSSVHWQRLARVVVIVLVLLHLVLAPLFLPLTSCQLAVIANTVQRNPLRRLLEASDTSGTTLVFVDPAIVPGMSHVVDYMGEARGLPVPDRLLALTQRPMKEKEMTRIDPYTIEIAIQDGLVDRESMKLLRGPLHPLEVGQCVTLTHLTAEIIELTADQRPRRVRFTFSVPLDDPTLVLLTWDGRRFSRFEPPGIGETVRIPPSRFFDRPPPPSERD